MGLLAYAGRLELYRIDAAEVLSLEQCNMIRVPGGVEVNQVELRGDSNHSLKRVFFTA